MKSGDLRARGHIELQPQRASGDLLAFDTLTAEFWEGIRLYPEQGLAIRHADDFDPRQPADTKFRWRIHNISIMREDAIAIFNLRAAKTVVSISDDVSPISASRDKGGRATKYDWAGAAAHFAIKYQWEGVVNQRDLKKALNDWFSAQDKDAPDPSDVGKFVKAALAAISAS